MARAIRRDRTQVKSRTSVPTTTHRRFPALPRRQSRSAALYSFTPTASDADVGIGGQLTFSIVNMPTWATFNTTTGQLSGTPPRGAAGNYPGIVIRVSDDGGVTYVSLTTFAIAVTRNPRRRQRWSAGR